MLSHNSRGWAWSESDGRQSLHIIGGCCGDQLCPPAPYNSSPTDISRAAAQWQPGVKEPDNSRMSWHLARLWPWPKDKRSLVKSSATTGTRNPVRFKGTPGTGEVGKSSENLWTSFVVTADITHVDAETLKVILGTHNYSLNRALWPFLQTEVLLVT